MQLYYANRKLKQANISKLFHVGNPIINGSDFYYASGIDSPNFGRFIIQFVEKEKTLFCFQRVKSNLINSKLYKFIGKNYSLIVAY